MVSLCLAAAIAVTGCGQALPPTRSDGSVFTLVHLSDVHIRMRFAAPQRLRLALRAVRRLKPDLVINSGDTVDGPRDTIDGTLDFEAKWSAWQEAVSQELKGVPLFNAVGNHDLDEPLTLADSCRRLGMPGPFYSFDRLGWRFIVLNSNGFAEDPRQWDWLVGQLRTTPVTVPIAIVSHHPIFSMGAMVNSPGDLIGRWRELVALFTRHPNVKLCLSGHTHLADVCRYNGVTYACGGSVSGYWWEIGKSSDGKGSYRQTPPGFNVIRLSSRGVASVEYRRYDDPATR
ncbi:MAG: metallophosphoesterase [Armatimonadetes bacterium]|nr:metallophosphoesterase [Armatimonadota bacterium]